MRLLSVGYKESIAEFANEDLEIVFLIDTFESIDTIPNKKNFEKRVFISNNTDDFFAYSTLLRSDIKEVDGVIASDEFTTFNAYALSVFYGVSLISASTAVKFRDKYLQKETLRRAKVPVTNFYMENQLSEELFNSNKKFIVKPNSGTGTELTQLVSNTKETKEAVRLIQKEGTEYNAVLIEEFVDGSEYFVDGWIRNGKIYALSLSKYHMGPLFKSLGERSVGITLPVEDYKEEYQEITYLATKSLTALGYTYGIFHMEFFQEKETKKWIFNEVGARLGGSSQDKLFEYYFGENLYKKQIEIACQQRTQDTIENLTVLHPTGKYVGVLLIQAPRDVPKFLPNVGDFSNENVIDIRYDWRFGQELPSMEKGYDRKFGRLMVSGDSFMAVDQELFIVENEFNKLIREE